MSTQAGLDQWALAKRVSVSRQWIVDIEKGKPRAGIKLVLRTLAALGLSLTTAKPPARGKVTDPPACMLRERYREGLERAMRLRIFGACA